MPGQHYLLFESDPRPTQSFLLMQPGVIDANVWFTNHQMVAEITVSEGAPSSETLLEECKKRLGLQNTPSILSLVLARLEAA